MIRAAILSLLLVVATGPAIAQDITLVLTASDAGVSGYTAYQLRIQNNSSQSVTSWNASIYFDPANFGEVFVVPWIPWISPVTAVLTSPGCWEHSSTLAIPVPPGETRLVLQGSVEILAGTPGDLVPVVFCGPPAMVAAGGPVAAATQADVIEILVMPFAIQPGSASVPYDGTTAVTVDIPVTIEDIDGPAQNTGGFSYGVGHDSTVLSVVELAPGPILADMDGGMGPAFNEMNLLDAGWTVGVVYGFISGPLLQFPGPEVVHVATYEMNAGLADGQPHNSNLQVTNTLGDPQVHSVVVVNGQSLPVLQGTGQVEFIPQQYRRGDANGDGALDLADGIFVLQYLFQGTVEPNCLAACDGNADGMIDLADGIHLIWYVSFGGAPPPAPFDECGFAESACAAFEACP